MSIMSKVSEFVRSLTSNQGNTDVPPGTDVPSSDEAAVPRPDRDPQVGFEAGRQRED